MLAEPGGTMMLTIPVKHSFSGYYTQRVSGSDGGYMKSRTVLHTVPPYSTDRSFQNSSPLAWPLESLSLFQPYHQRWGSTVERECLKDLRRHGVSTKSSVWGISSVR
jgi:hypothetical protein